jgi:hypothetical protein
LGVVAGIGAIDGGLDAVSFAGVPADVGFDCALAVDAMARPAGHMTSANASLTPKLAERRFSFLISNSLDFDRERLVAPESLVCLSRFRPFFVADRAS